MLKHVKITLAVFCAAAALTACKSSMKIKHLPYPDAERTEVVDNYFGTEVADPYRWLEDDRSEQTAAWVAAENAVTQNYLDQIPFREAMRARLTELWAYPWEGAPAKFGDYYYFYRNDGRQNQAVLYRQASLDAEPEVFLDPNTLSEDGTVALSGISFSEDGRYLAYAASASGSDWSDIHVIRTADKQPTGDIVKWVKLSNAVWTPDEKGFYYSTFDVPEAGVYSSQNQYQKVYYHTLGKPQSSDRLIHMDTQHPLRYFASSVSKDGKWLFITASEGTSGSEILYRKSSDKKFKVLLPGFANDHEIIRAENDKLYVRTNLDAPNYRVIRIDLNNPSVIEEIIPENPKNMLEIVSKPGDYMMASYLEDAQSQVYQYDWNGKLIRKVELPAIGSAGGFSGKKGETEAFYSLTNFTTPSTVYRYDLATGESTLYKRPEVKFSPEDYTTEQVFYTSKDGTKVPMFIVYRNGLKLDGNNPCYLYAYGGFQVSLAPWFNPAAIMFMEQGGVYCVANLRGGLEYGEEWHRGGMLDKKQNVFDDFIAAAEYLIANKYTSSKKLAIAGGSNGGLLVGACEVQRPDLFGVCLLAACTGMRAQDPLIEPEEGRTLLERFTKGGKSISSSSMNLQFYTSAAARFNDGSLEEAAFKLNGVRLELLGDFGKDFSYHFRQSFNKYSNPHALDNLSSSVEVASVAWRMAPRFALTVGKQAIQLSGYEYWVDAIRVREFSDFNNYIECYQAGVNGAVSLSPTQTLNLQVVNNSAAKDDGPTASY